MHTREEVSLSGRSLSIETGKWAKQAHGAEIVGMGDKMVMVTA